MVMGTTYGLRVLQETNVEAIRPPDGARGGPIVAGPSQRKQVCGSLVIIGSEEGGSLPIPQSRLQESDVFVVENQESSRAPAQGKKTERTLAREASTGYGEGSARRSAQGRDSRLDRPDI
jgi:hypothetical protein